MSPAFAQQIRTRGHTPDPSVFADLTGTLLGTQNGETPVGAAGWFANWRATGKAERLAVLLIELDRVSLVQSVAEGGPDTTPDRLSKHLEKVLPYGSYLERIGVDLFLAVVGDLASTQEAVDLAGNMLGEIEDSLAMPLNPRIGVALYPDAGSDIAVLARRATIALTDVHDKSSSRVRLWSGPRRSPTDNNYRLASDLGRALAHKEIELNYQPKISTASGRVSGMEALVRWYHPRFGRIEPDEFVPLAEANGLINQLGEWVLFTACRQLRYWQDEGLSPGTIAVNVSAHQVAGRGFTDMVTWAFRECGLTPGDLTLELTESAVIRDDDSATEAVQELCARGVRFSIDDFGTGHATFSNLRRLAVDSVKIDRSFVSGMVHNTQDAVIVEAIIVMAEKLGLSVIAEGVETLEQFRRLRDLGCEEIQGFLFSTPLAEDELAAFLARQHRFTV